MSDKMQAALDSIRDLRPYALAGDADCSGPDSAESEGALFLTRVRDSFVEAVEYGHDAGEDETAEQIIERLRGEGSLSDIADGAPSVYTHTKWQQFVDLAAYNEDPTELGSDGSDMGQAAAVCLYMIAERLVESLAGQVVKAWDDAEDDA